MYTRYQVLHQWLKNFFSHEQFTITSLAGDASFRRYFRIQAKHSTYVLMDAPPEKETMLPFIEIGKTLAEIGVHTPAVYGFDAAQGFALLEDFGDKLFLNSFSTIAPARLYEKAMSTLLTMQQCEIKGPFFPVFDSVFMLKELSLFKHWFLQIYLELSLNEREEKLFKDTFTWLTNEISKQPQVFIHRDYHSRNLMILESGHDFDLGIIDFQDAMKGPFTYDLVSLLKDCYLQWPRAQVIEWLTYFYNKLPSSNMWTLHDFTRGFDLCGLQRHLKVLGIFCRLHFRDKKSAYLKDLPLILNYVMGFLEMCHELKPFYEFLQAKVHKPFIEKQLCQPL